MHRNHTNKLENYDLNVIVKEMYGPHQGVFEHPTTRNDSYKHGSLAICVTRDVRPLRGGFGLTCFGGFLQLT